MRRMPSLRTVGLMVALAGLSGLVGCAEPAEAPGAPQPMAAGADTTAADTLSAPASLADTQWRLVEFQSMDDASMAPEDSVLYTLDLGADGTVAMQLNCNRGTGTWTAEPGSGADSAPDVETGTLAFGPLAVTRALCPPPSMDEQITRDMGYVRGYYLRGDTLSLSLMADGGLYLWVPREGGGS